MKKRIFLLCVAVVVILAGIRLYNNQKKVQEKVYRPDPDQPTLVKTSPATLQKLVRKYTYNGTFKPYREVSLIPQSQGEVTGVFFDQGQLVKKDQLLVQLDDELLRAQQMAARAAFETAKSNLERYEKAAQSEGISQMQLESYRLESKKAQSEYLQIEKNIRLKTILAPFTGYITLKDVERGAVVTTASPIGRVTDLSQVKLQIYVPEREILFFNDGASISIYSDLEPEKILTGKIDYVSLRADESHNYEVNIIVANDKLTNIRAGMYGTAVIYDSTSSPHLIVPRAALLGSSKKPQVYIVEEGIAKLKSVRIGRSNEEELEIVSGLREGVQVIYSGQINLKDGVKVQIANN